MHAYIRASGHVDIFALVRMRGGTVSYGGRLRSGNPEDSILCYITTYLLIFLFRCCFFVHVGGLL